MKMHCCSVVQNLIINRCFHDVLSMEKNCASLGVMDGESRFKVMTSAVQWLSVLYVRCWILQKYEFTTSFTDHSHVASVRSVAVSVNGVAASGSADETIKLFDADKRVEIGSLVHHQGKYNCCISDKCIL
jgi:WD40 repeat protein